MKKSILFYFISALLIVNACIAQNFSNNYTPLTSIGKLPDDFVISATSKAQADIVKLKKQNDSKSKEKMRFIISNTFFIDNVLKSGKVLYGDPISKYVGKVADEVLKKDISLREKLRIYVVKSPVVNAYAFDNGIILITTGLISQLENEAQLAFVLCHEIVHYNHKHSMNARLEFLSMNKKKRSFNRNGTNLLLEKSKFSKKQESQADEEGFQSFTLTPYSYKSIDGLFDVFQYSYLPFEDMEFDKKYFNDQSFIIPDAYYLDKVKDISSDDNYNDSLSTHPNIRKRREKISDLVQGKSDEGRKEFVVSQLEFERARDFSRFETCRMYMQDIDYPEAIYSAYVLLKKYPNNLYLKKTIANSLYEVAVYKSLYDEYSYNYLWKNGVMTYYKKRVKSRVERVIDCKDSIQGSSQQVFYLLNKLSPMEATTLALRNNWLLYKQGGYADPYAKDICDSLMKILVRNNQVKLDDFSKTPKAAVVDTVKIIAEKKPQSKYDKIRKKSKNKITDDSFIKYAFVDILNDKMFSDKYEEIYKTIKPIKKEESVKFKTLAEKKKAPVATSKNKSKKKEEEDREDDSNTSTEQDSVKVDEKEVQAANKNTHNDLSKFKQLGIDNIVIVDPVFMKLDERKKEQMQYFSGDDRRKFFTQLLDGNAKLIDLDHTILSPGSFSEDDVESYNGLTCVNDWISEKLMHSNFSSAMVLNRDFKTELLKKYGTKYFLWTGVVSIQKKTHAGWWIAVSIYAPYVFPYAIYKMVAPNYDTYYYAFLFNIENGKLELSQQHEIDMNDKQCVLNSMIYDTFFQIKKGNKQ
ncbi:MAG: M48 family metalloprotease [Bacteroidetes bacterium]|nr:M48 family metalloprotease [Bacteroidota bacterium]